MKKKIDPFTIIFIVLVVPHYILLFAVIIWKLWGGG